MPARKLLTAIEARELQTHLNVLLALDSMHVMAKYKGDIPPSRIRLLRAEVILVGDGRDITQPDPVANAGITTDATGRLTLAPIAEADVYQGYRADCVLLASILSWTFKDPNFSDDLIYATSPSTAVVQFWISGAILRIHTSLILATDFNDFNLPPNQQNVRIALFEKCWGFARSGINDYLKDDYAGGGDVFTAWGLDAAVITLASLQQSLAAGKLAVFITGAATGTDSAGHPYNASHCYAVKSFDGVNAVMQNPWWGGTDITVTADQIQNAGFWIGPYIAAIPNPKRLLAPAITPAPTPTPTPAPMPTTEADAIARLTADVAQLKAAIATLLSARST